MGALKDNHVLSEILTTFQKNLPNSLQKILHTWEVHRTYYSEVNYWDDSPIQIIFLADDAGRSAHIYLSELPGNCGVLVSFCTLVYDQKYTRQGVATQLLELKKAIGRRFGYTVLLATDTTQNERQLNFFQKNNWENIYTFKSVRTGNENKIWVIPIV